ncbi:MAG: hypothetical protein BWY19_00750 [bacterium ADurb.Bin212]|nr:MAG: hypothetical protein BWY19_00750 [bacterium ADurb.Bin212]
MSPQQNDSNINKKQKMNQGVVKYCLGPFVLLILIMVIVLVIVLIADNSNIKPIESNKTKTNDSNASNINKSDEDIIKDTITAKYSGKNNRDQDKIRSIRVTSQVDGGYGVIVEFNADELLSQSSTRKDIIYTSSQMLKTIYKETGKEIKQAAIFAYYPMTDKYGNNSDEVVYKCTFDKETADKVNWGQDENQLFWQTLPNLWTASNDLLK